MTNIEIARSLRQVAAAYLLKGENRFRITAYEKAADTLEKSTIEAEDLWQNHKLDSLPGIGPAIASHLDELFRTGKVKHFTAVFKGLPQALFPLLEVPGFGPKKAYKLVTVLKLRRPDTVTFDLLKAAYAGKIAVIEGFGEKSQQDIIETLERFKGGRVSGERMPLPYAYTMASEILDYLKQHKDTVKAVMLGSLRRMVSTIGDIDIAVSTNNPDEIVEWFVKYPKAQKIVEKGPSGATILLNNGRQIDLRVLDPSMFGAMLQYFTGSKQHNIHLREFALKRGLSLSEYGIKPVGKTQISNLKSQNYNSKLKIYEFDTEEKFYQALGLPWIPPELREDLGEIEAGIREIQGKQPGVPKLIELKDIKGDLHLHSDYNLEPSHDLGASSPETILKEAKNHGYEYVGISDHNPSYTNHSMGQIISIMKRRKEIFEQKLKSIKSVRVQLFIMLEIDILPDGKLALPEEAFPYIDAAIVSIHSSFRMDKETMTDRIIKGLSHPKAKIFAHPTGRLIGKRAGYEINWDKLFAVCRRENKAIEINAFPERLDLPDALVHEAIKQQVKLVINTDSHDASQMELMHYGVSVARRGWATKDDILNTLNYNKLKDWLLKVNKVLA